MKRKDVEAVSRQAVMAFIAEKEAAKPQRKPREAKAAPVPRQALKIGDGALATSKHKRRNDTVPFDAAVAFAAARPGPKVVPEGKATLAMDSDITGYCGWAATGTQAGWGGYGVAYSQGYSFQGYQELALLSTIPEYRRIAQVWSTEATRKWIKLKSVSNDKNKSERIKELTDEMKRLDVQSAFNRISMQDCQFGRAHLYLDFDTWDKDDELKTPIGDGRNAASRSKIGTKNPLKRIQPVEAVWAYPSNYNSNNPLAPDWYKPSMWFAMGKELHVSRFLTFIGLEVPDLLKPAYSFGGQALIQLAKPVVDLWLRDRQSVSNLLNNFSTMWLETELGESLQQNGEQMFARAQLFNNNRDNQGLMLLQQGMEKVGNVAVPLGSLDQLQAQSLEHVPMICGIPLMKYTGIQPAGLNATGEGELVTFDDNIHAYQTKFFTHNLQAVIWMIELSLWDEIDEDIVFEYEPLRSLDDLQLANLRKLNADTAASNVDRGITAPVEERQKLADDPQSGYNSLAVDDVPESTDPEPGNIREREDVDEDPADADHREAA